MNETDTRPRLTLSHATLAVRDLDAAERQALVAPDRELRAQPLEQIPPWR